MRVLVIGSGAREHALCHALTNDPAVSDLHAAPGNAGIAGLATCHAVDVADPAAVASLAARLKADYVIIGPEIPLVAGAADAVRALGIETFGPSKAAAQLEGSKAFANEVMAAASVATAASESFDDPDAAESYLRATAGPYVVKDDGLAAGKGVVVTDDLEEAVAHARACASSGRVVIEECLTGPEVSLFAIVTDDGRIVPMVPAQDHKRVGDGDTGPNTGGMGAYSPLPWAPHDLVERTTAEVLQPVVNEMAARGCPYTGLLYAGLMLTPDGIKVIEFNCRFGDPETQVVLARLKSPVTELLRGAGEPVWSDDAAVTVVVAAEGYPEMPITGAVITGLESANAVPHVVAFHAGTATGPNAEVLSAGGRVLSVTAVGTTFEDARDSAYAAVGEISLAGSHHRTDIGHQALAP